MRLTLLHIHLYIPESHSLKEKRHSIKSIKDKLRARLNVSVAEVGHQESWQRCDLAVAWVSGDGELTDSISSKIENIVLNAQEVQILDVQRYEY